MRDRLIEILKKSGASFENALPEEISDHLLAEGVIVLPCKEGDRIYALSASRTKIYTFIVTEFLIKGGYIIIYGYGEGDLGLHAVCTDKDIGTNDVFLTREEAERVLERSENGKS